MPTCRQCGDPHDPGESACPRTRAPVSEGPCGTRIDRYDVERLLARGGIGAVYRARHAMLGQPVALKLLRPEAARDADLVGRFLREARAAAAIRSPHIVNVSDFGVTPDGVAFLAMELLEGSDLDELLRREGRLAPGRAVALARQVLDGLAAAHAAGIVHRDMKPANVFLVPNGPGGAVLAKLLDFGISKMRDAAPGASATRVGAILGTPAYMAPEQFGGAADVDARADVYAVAAMLYQMLTGATPYSGATAESILVQVATSSPRPVRELAPHVSASLAAAVERGLAREPDARYPTAAAFAAALRDAEGASDAVAFAATAPVPSAHGGTPAPVAARSTPPPSSHPHGSLAQPLASHPTPSHHGAPSSVAAAAAPPPPSRGGLVIALSALGTVALLAGLAGVGYVVFAGGAIASDAREPEDEAEHQHAPVVVGPQPAQQPAQAPDQPAAQGPAPADPQSPPVAQVVADAEAAPRPVDPSGVAFSDVSVVGPVPLQAIRDALERARGAVDACRVAGRGARVRVHATVNDGEVTTSNPDLANTGEQEVAECVANAFESDAGSIASEATGVVRFTADLRPR